MKKLRYIGLVLVCSSLAACVDAESPDVDQARAPMPPTLPGTYGGEFPCSNCSAIDAMLWLREDRRFVFRQRYLSSSGVSDGPDAFSLGRWDWDEARAELVLRGAGPERRFRIVADDQLEWILASTAPHLLRRDPVARTLAENMPVTGVAVVTGSTASFRECLSQIEREVAADEGLSVLRRQHRAFSPRGRPALTSMYARLGRVAADDAAAEVWIIDRVLSVNPDATC